MSLDASRSTPTGDPQSRMQNTPRTERILLAGLTLEQREAVASMIENAQPWHELGLDTEVSYSRDEVAYLLSIVADSVRLQFDPER